MDDYKLLETNLDEYVLSRYDLPSDRTIWRSHDKVGLDDVVHYFSRYDTKYALVYNDHPNETFIHEENLKPIHTIGGSDEWLHIESGDPMAGYYSLYEDQ